LGGGRCLAGHGFWQAGVDEKLNQPDEVQPWPMVNGAASVHPIAAALFLLTSECFDRDGPAEMGWQAMAESGASV